MYFAELGPQKSPKDKEASSRIWAAKIRGAKIATHNRSHRSEPMSVAARIVSSSGSEMLEVVDHVIELQKPVS